MVSLRHFNDSDATVLSELAGVGVSEAAEMIRDWNSLAFHGRYFEMFAITSGGGIVGTISLYQLSDSVVSIGPEVFPEFRRRGFAKEAMLLAMDAAKSKGYKIVSQQIRSDNAASIALHKSLGFETDGYGYTNKKGKEVFIFLKSLL